MGVGASRSRREQPRAQPAADPAAGAAPLGTDPNAAGAYRNSQPPRVADHPAAVQNYSTQYNWPQQHYYGGRMPAANNGQFYGGFQGGPVPYPVPYQQQLRPAQPPATQMAEQTQRTSTIRNDVNLKKSTLRVMQDEANPGKLLVAFSFDAAAPCSISVFFGAEENVQEACKLTSGAGEPAPRVAYEKGLGQEFKTAPHHGLSLASVNQADLLNQTANKFPLVVRLETLNRDHPEAQAELPLPPGCPLPKWVQAQTTYATLSKGEDGEYVVRVLKQKIWVEGVSYELQEIYGIEQCNNGSSGGGGGDDIGKECVICMSEPRDTTVLPCRHMCMCSGCARMLRHQTNRCPICRTTVEGLLEIKVERRT